MNGAADEEILAKSDLDEATLTAALASWRSEAMVVADLPTNMLEHLVIAEIGGFLRLTMARYANEARQEFSDQLILELADVPYVALVPALQEARRKICYPERLVPFIFDFIEARVDKLTLEGDRLKRLGEILLGGA